MTIDIPTQKRVTSFIPFSQSCPSNAYYSYFTPSKPCLIISICIIPSSFLLFRYTISVKSTSKESACQI